MKRISSTPTKRCALTRPEGLRMNPDLLEGLPFSLRFHPMPPVSPLSPEEAWRIYAPPRTLGASEEHQLAMDAQLQDCGFHSLVAHAVNLGMGMEEIAPQFPGYSYLAGLSQNALIRAGVTTVADEMTKRWVKVKSACSDTMPEASLDRRVKCRVLTNALRDFGLQDLFNEAAQKCDFDGGCLIFIDTGTESDAELGKELFLDGALLQGRIKGFRLVEAINLYPGYYNAVDPLSPGYFQPDSWLVLGKRVHCSRFLYFAPNRVNMMLRPAYNFFGIPAAQLALDYVAHFSKNREAAQRLLTKFSLTVFKSDMTQILSGGSASNMDLRLQYLAQKRDNDAILLIDKEREDLFKLETPLNGVTEIVRQSLEFVAAIFRIPFVKFLGISPGGLNATGESDLRNFYDHVGSKQQTVLRQPLNRVLDILQLHLFGSIDPEIYAEFVGEGASQGAGDELGWGWDRQDGVDAQKRFVEDEKLPSSRTTFLSGALDRALTDAENAPKTQIGLKVQMALERAEESLRELKSSDLEKRMNDSQLRKVQELEQRYSRIKSQRGL